MKPTLLLALLCAMVAPITQADTVALFDGKTLAGWEGDKKLWWVEDGAITGGSRTEVLPENEFLASQRSFADFELRLKIRLSGEGFVNSGIQIRSQRLSGGPQMIGYQVDAGDKYWGLLYDESRRNDFIARSSDMKAVTAAVRGNDWNEYRIRAEGPRIRTWINGVPALDYTERDAAIALTGRIGIQVHGGGKTIVQVKDVTIEEL